MNLRERELENQERVAHGVPPRWQTDTTHGAPCDVCPGCPDAGQEVWLYCANCGGHCAASSWPCDCPPEDWLANR